ncbi:MAG: trypsin-like peptidase domain-containing protein [Vicinamibacterales bacterium]
MRRFVSALVLVAVGVVLGVALSGRGSTPAAALGSSSDAEIVALAPGAAPPVPPPAAGVSPTDDQGAVRRSTAALPNDLPDFADVASRTVGSVTNISVLQVSRAPANPFMNDPFFRQFFGDEQDLFGYSERRGMSAGSGVLVSEDGLVLTNNHVLGENVRTVTVVLADRRSREAKVVGVDTVTDLALLKIDGRGFPTVTWGDSAKLRVAEWVLAIGNPFQIGQTVTLGIVSALGRANVNISAYEDFIQTDAAINPGNSGGALINRRGELVGINTAIFSQSGGYQGIGFAVPSNLARKVMEDLSKFGEVRRGSIGTMRTVAITPELARDLGTTSTAGVLIWEMNRSSPAYQAGLRPGDVIETLNAEPVTDPGQFFRLVSDTPLGTIVTLQVRRERKTLEFKVPVQRMTTRRDVA